VAIVSVTIAGNAGPLRKELSAADKFLGNFGLSVNKVGIAATAAFSGLAAGIGSAIGKASDLNETMSKTGVIFGAAQRDVVKFAEGAARSLGQTTQQALDAAATFGIFGQAAGLTGQSLAKFSTDFTALASDLASFNNTSPEDAIQAIGAALRGEAEPLRRYGVLLDDATLKNAAFELGIYEGSGALTAQQKVLAAQKVIFEQTAIAQGDFARTSEGLANQQRILSAELENLQTKLGEAFLPLVLAVIPKLTDMAAVLSENSKAVIIVVTAVTGFTAAIVAAVGALKVYNTVATITNGINGLLSKSFAGARVSALGMGTAIGLVMLTLTEFYSMMKDQSAWYAFKQSAGNAFALVNNLFFAVANQIRNAVTVVANGLIQIANVGIDALNKLIPGNPISKIDQYDYAAWNEGFRSFDFTPFEMTMGAAQNRAGAAFPNLIGENRGGAITVDTTPAIIVPPALGGAGGGGGGGGGGARVGAGAGSPAIYAPTPMEAFTAESFMRAHEQMFGVNEITVNVNGALATQAEIGDAVYQALRTAQDLNGPLNLAIA
jgi:hypothetical protein